MHTFPKNSGFARRYSFEGGRGYFLCLLLSLIGVNAALIRAVDGLGLIGPEALSAVGAALLEYFRIYRELLAAEFWHICSIEVSIS